jgi:hypothetical protein
VYIFEMRVRNASSALYTMRRMIFGIYFPDEGLDFEETLRKKLTPPMASEIVMNSRCPPHAYRNICAISRESDTLYHMVLTVWKAEYCSRRLLGVLGQCDGVAEGGWFGPVDAQSLALYADTGKQRESNPTVLSDPNTTAA